MRAVLHGVSHRSSDNIVRGTSVSSASDRAFSPDDCLGRCLRVRRTIAGSRLSGTCFDRSACVQSATEVSRRLDVRSYRFFRVCIAAGLCVANGFSDWCLRGRRVAEASRLLCDCDDRFLCVCSFIAVSRLIVLRVDSSAYVSPVQGFRVSLVANVTDLFESEA